MKVSSTSVGVLGLLSASFIACSAAPASMGADEETTASQGAALALAPRCYGQMRKLFPTELDQPIGSTLTIRINRQCISRAPLVNKLVRVYARKADNSAPAQLIMDWTSWPAAQYGVEQPWVAGSTVSGATLPAGLYRIYSYTLNASLYNDWLANDPYARNMSTVSDNTYVNLVDAGTWSSTSWSSCSALCDGGLQTRTNTCVDASQTPINARFCVSSAPSASQACNQTACTCGNGGTCTVFVTSTTVSADMGGFYGLMGADMVCAQRAQMAGLTGTYKAWLSDGAQSPATRFTQNPGPYALRSGGMVVASSWSNLLSGYLSNPIERDEYGSFVSGNDAAWSNVSGTTGAAASVDHCHGWSTTSSSEYGRVGDITSTSGWSSAMGIECSNTAHLYCFQQD